MNAKQATAERRVDHQLAELSQLRATVQDVREKMQELFAKSEDDSLLESHLNIALGLATSLHVQLGRARDAVKP